MKRILSLLTILALGVCMVWSVPAIKTPVVFTQKDGVKITIRIYGDEFGSYRTTADGYQIVERDGIYYYYQMGSGTKSTTELVRANDPANRTPAERQFLSSCPRGTAQFFANNVMRTQYVLPNISDDPFTRSATKEALPPKALILLVQFADTKFTVSTNDIKNMLTQQGYSKNGATGCVQDYFRASSKGAYVPEFEISPIITLSKEYAFYGKKAANENDKHADLMVVEACQLAESYIDFTQFASDGKQVDGVYVIYAGHNQAEGANENTIWPHRWSLWRYQNTYVDGVKIWDYACGSELRGASGTTQAGIGTFCHEFGHVLGLPDFYDTDGDTGGSTVGLYNISIMSGGNYNNNGNTPPYYNAVERWILGWNTLKPLEKTNELTIKPISEENDAWYINSKKSQEEFYVIESRLNQSWDAPLGNSGLLIYHVDMTTNMAAGIRAIERWGSNSINNSVAYPCMRLLESVGRTLTKEEQWSSANYSKIFYPGSTNNRTFDETSYGGVDWQGQPLQMRLLDIDNTNGTVTLSVSSLISDDGTLDLHPYQREIKVDISYAEQVDKFVLAYKTNTSVAWRETELTKETKSFTIKDLSPSTLYDIQLYSVIDGTKNSLARDECRTLATTSRYGAIKGIKASYKVGDKLSVETTNLSESAKSVVFEIDGTQINSDQHTLTKVGSQILKCTITYKNGSKEIITRKIKVQ